MNTPTVSPVAHVVEDGLESYEFESAVNPEQVHFVTRLDEGPWTIGPVNIPNDDLSVAQTEVLISELQDLIAFARMMESAS